MCTPQRFRMGYDPSLVPQPNIELAPPVNIVRDYNKVQGVTHPSDLSVSPVRDINVRYVSIENSGKRPIAVGITTYSDGPVPHPNFVLGGGEIKHVAINSIGEAMQFIHLMNIENGQRVGRPAPFRTDANSFVLRDGLNLWFVDTFRFPSFRAPH